MNIIPYNLPSLLDCILAISSQRPAYFFEDLSLTTDTKDSEILSTDLQLQLSLSYNLLDRLQRLTYYHP